MEVQKIDGCNYLSVYKDEFNPIEGVKQLKRVQVAFPSLPNGFFDMFLDRLKEKKFSTQRLIDSINHVIDTCQYPTPTLAQFLSFDKRTRLYTYNEVCIEIDKGDSFKYYEIREIKGVKWWVRKSD